MDPRKSRFCASETMETLFDLFIYAALCQISPNTVAEVKGLNTPKVSELKLKVMAGDAITIKYKTQDITHTHTIAMSL